MLCLIAVIVGFALGSLLLRGKALPECSAAALEAADRAVKATVDGKPVHSYIADD